MYEQLGIYYCKAYPNWLSTKIKNYEKTTGHQPNLYLQIKIQLV